MAVIQRTHSFRTLTQRSYSTRATLPVRDQRRQDTTQLQVATSHPESINGPSPGETFPPWRHSGVQRAASIRG
eukprot:1083491-Prorocentrum_minimum.AAC.1